MHKTIMDKVIDIYNHSQLSISKFAKILDKDRRTISSWIYKEVNIEPKKEILDKISNFFRYPDEIWKDECQDDNFLNLMNTIPTKDVRIIDENHTNRLKYILSKEDEQRLVIHPKFPGAVYRDAIAPKLYRIKEDKDLEKLKKLRITKMLEYSYKSDEWYDIKSLLNFCFSEIGNFYSKEEKLSILELMYNTFHDNYNKHLFLFDSFSKKIYGLDNIYTSVDIKNKLIFFKSPLESVFIEITNKEIVEKIHKYFTSSKQSPSHISTYDATIILKILKEIISKDLTLFDAYRKINEKTKYGELIKNNISVSSHHKLYTIVSP